MFDSPSNVSSLWIPSNFVCLLWGLSWLLWLSAPCLRCLPPCDNVVDIKYFGCLQHGVDTEVGQYSLPRVTAIIQELECRHDIQISPFSHSVMLDLCGRTEFSSRISVCTDFSFHFC